MRDLFIWYSNKLSDEIPQYVYVALLSVFCLAGILILTNYGIKKGWRKVITTLLGGRQMNCVMFGQ